MAEMLRWSGRLISWLASILLVMELYHADVLTIPEVRMLSYCGDVITLQDDSLSVALTSNYDQSRECVVTFTAASDSIRLLVKVEYFRVGMQEKIIDTVHDDLKQYQPREGYPGLFLNDSDGTSLLAQSQRYHANLNVNQTFQELGCRKHGVTLSGGDTQCTVTTSYYPVYGNIDKMTIITTGNILYVDYKGRPADDFFELTVSPVTNNTSLCPSTCSASGACVLDTQECVCVDRNVTGVNCDQDVDECVEYDACSSKVDPTQRCENLQPGYQCACEVGYELINEKCQDINECLETSPQRSPCPVNSTCENTVGSFTCVCAHGYRLNEAKDGCIEDCESTTLDCGEGGHCNMSADSNRPYCVCNDTYTGERCHEGCGEIHCYSGGVCELLGNNKPQCNCAGTNYTGPFCTREISVCDDEQGPCNNGGVCFKSDDGTFQCLCPDSWIGRTCSLPKDGGQAVAPCCFMMLVPALLLVIFSVWQI